MSSITGAGSGGGSTVGVVKFLQGNSGGPVGPDITGLIFTQGGNNITSVGNPGTNTVTFSLTGTTNHTVQLGNSTGSLTSLTNGTTGQILTAQTGADPIWAAAPAASITLNGDSGSASGSTLSVLANGNSRAGATWAFTGSGSTLTLTSKDANHNLAVGAGNSNFVANSVFNCTFVGHQAGININASTGRNDAFGVNSMFAFLGTGGQDFNTAFGADTLSSITTGQFNYAFGSGAGLALTGNDSGNICIGHQGQAGDNGILRIGNSYTGSMSKVFIDGITGVTTGGAAVAVLIDGSGQLGTISSSRKVKENIQSFDSSPILKAEPVSFNYINQPGITTYGVIAEDLKEVMPDLVVEDDKGNMSLKSHEVPWILLAEIKKLVVRIDALESQLKGK